MRTQTTKASACAAETKQESDARVSGTTPSPVAEDPQRVELEVRLQEGDGAIGTGFTRNIHDVDASFAQRVGGFRVLAGIIVEDDVLCDPLIEPGFALGAGHEAADLVAHHGFQVVSKAADGEDVRQLCREAGIGVGRFLVVQLGFLGGLDTEKRGIIGVLAMDQGDETLVGQFLFPAIRDGDFGGALHDDISVIRAEVVDRKPVDHAAAFDATDSGAPMVFGEGLRQLGAHGPCGVHPQILAVIRAVHALFVVESFDGGGILAIRKPAENARDTETDVAGIF
jgi:hypothetical protein